jgi:hypothetical protein
MIRSLVRKQAVKHALNHAVASVTIIYAEALRRMKDRAHHDGRSITQGTMNKPQRLENAIDVADVQHVDAF